MPSFKWLSLAVFFHILFADAAYIQPTVENVGTFNAEIQPGYLTINPSLLNKEVETAKYFVKSYADIAKETVDILAQGSNWVNKIANEIVDYCTGMGNVGLSGGLSLVSQGLDVGSAWAHKAINVGDTVGNVMPEEIGTAVHKGTELANEGVNKLEEYGKVAISKISEVGSEGFIFSNGILHEGNDYANDLIQKGASAIQGAIDNGRDTLTKGIDAALANL